MRKGLLFIIFILVAISFIFSYNYFLFQNEMDNAINSDPRNDGISVSVHLGNFLNPSVLVYDLHSISDTKSMADVFRVFLQFAEKMQSQRFDMIELSFKGKTNFLIKGEYFQTLGEEYSWQNPVYTIRTFPKNLYKPDGTRAYSEWSGGLLGVMGKQMEDFTDFNRKWYLEDLQG